MKIYFAAPLFNRAECAYNLELTQKLEKIGFSVFLPQRDGIDGIGTDKPPYNTMSKDEISRHIFTKDRENIIDSDIFLFILDGRVPDEGGCVELGIAYEHKIQQNHPQYIVGLHTDTRATHLGAKFNPMIKAPLDFLTEDEDKLLDYLQKILHKN